MLPRVVSLPVVLSRLLGCFHDCTPLRNIRHGPYQFSNKSNSNCRIHTTTSTTTVATEDHRITSTRRWLERIVIGEKQCPFAPPFLLHSHLLRMVVAAPTFSLVASVDKNNSNNNGSIDTTKPDEDHVLQLVAQEVQLLVQQTSEQITTTTTGNQASAHETTLVILDYPFLKDFRDFVRFSWILQDEAIVRTQYLHKLQLVLFHPQATHQTYGMDANDDNGDNDNPGNYTIRSPYPTIHLLRQQDVLKAVTSGYPNLETLPSRNKARMIAQGLDVCRERLASCYVQSKEANIQRKNDCFPIEK